MKNNVEKGNDLESYVKYVYSVLLNLKGENIIVSKKADLQDVYGVTHNIDVFYQFEKVGITHKVAFECKNWNTAVTKEKVAAFAKIIEDIKGVVGVMVSNKGYQSGAKQYATANRILTLTTDELPNILDLLSMQITKYFLPYKEDIGEPFWTLMELDDKGQITGSYYTPQKDDNGNDILLLMFSKKQAEELIEFRRIPKTKYTPRGLRQYHLKGMLAFMKQHKVVFAVLPPYVPKNTPEGAFFIKNVQEIENEFLIVK